MLSTMKEINFQDRLKVMLDEYKELCVECGKPITIWNKGFEHNEVIGIFCENCYELFQDCESLKTVSNHFLKNSA